MNDLTSSRDMDLVRKILFALEKKSPSQEVLLKEIDDCDFDTAYYHIQIMADVGLVKLTRFVRIFDPNYTPNSIEARLTWEGHEFLEAVRDDKRWEKVKAEMSKGGGFVYEIAKSIALDFFEEEINPNRVQAIKLQLIKRYTNLGKLEVQAAGHSANAIPLELSNAIDAEKEAITELEDRLRLLTG